MASPGTRPTCAARFSGERKLAIRRVGLALRGLADEQREVDEAVAAARHNGRSRGEIGLALGISRQAARERYGQAVTRR